MRFVTQRLFIVKYLLITCVLVLIFSCKTETKILGNDPSFRLVILNDEMSKKFREEARSEGIPAVLLKQAYDSGIDVSFSEADIDIYNWTDQTITLTGEASEKLAEALRCSVEEVEICILERSFAVAIEDRILYGGIFDWVGTAQFIETPTIYTDVVDGRIVFTIRPVNVPWIEPDIKDDRWVEIMDPKIEVLFSSLDKIP